MTDCMPIYGAILANPAQVNQHVNACHVGSVGFCMTISTPAVHLNILPGNMTSQQLPVCCSAGN